MKLKIKIVIMARYLVVTYLYINFDKANFNNTYDGEKSFISSKKYCLCFCGGNSIGKTIAHLPNNNIELPEDTIETIKNIGYNELKFFINALEELFDGDLEDIGNNIYIIK